MKRECQGALRHGCSVHGGVLGFFAKFPSPLESWLTALSSRMKDLFSPLCFCIIGREISFPTDAAARLPVPSEGKHSAGEAVLVKRGTDGQVSAKLRAAGGGIKERETVGALVRRL